MTIKIKKCSFIVAVNIIFLLVLIFTAELISSFFVQKGGSNVISEYRLNHTQKPNSKNVHREWISSDFPYPFTHVYNRQGWIENYDIELTKEPNTYRIFYVGDSFTQGTVPMEKSVPSIVEQRLNKLAKGTNVKFEVINTGTASYSPTIFYILVRYVLMNYSPDLIVVNIDMTDDFGDWKYSETLIRDNEGNPWAVPPRDIFKAPFVDTGEGVVKANTWTKLQLFLFQYSYSYNFIRKYLHKKNINSDPVETLTMIGKNPEIYQRWAWCKKEWDEFTIKNVNRTLDFIRRLAVLCKLANIKVMFTSVPHYYQYASNHDGTGEPLWSSRPHYEIAKIVEENDALYLNSYEKIAPFIMGTPWNKYYYKGDMHFNPSGYQIWAMAQIEFLTNKTNALLPQKFY